MGKKKIGKHLVYVSQYHPQDILDPDEGDLVHAWEIGKGNGPAPYRWTRCPQCSKFRWVIKYEDPNIICRKCAGIRQRRDGSPNWAGGNYVNDNGYRMMRIYNDHPFFNSMGRINGIGSDNTVRLIAEHRLVMAEHLGRPLRSWEAVHHINDIKVDNRLENLELTTPPNHVAHSLLVQENNRLHKRIDSLEQELNKLRLKDD